MLTKQGFGDNMVGDCFFARGEFVMFKIVMAINNSNLNSIFGAVYLA